MGVISVVSVGTSDHWSGVKPDDYKGTELDKAIQAWEGLANKTVDIPKDLIPSPPECKVRALTSYIDELKSVVKELDGLKSMVNQYITALKALQAAGNKAAVDLTKMSQDKKVSDEMRQKYTSATSAASAIAASAGSKLKDYE